MADEGRLGAQVLFLHDAGRRDGEGDQVEGEDHGKEGTKNGDLRGCRQAVGTSGESPVQPSPAPTRPSWPEDFL